MYNNESEWKCSMAKLRCKHDYHIIPRFCLGLKDKNPPVFISRLMLCIVEYCFHKFGKLKIVVAKPTPLCQSHPRLYANRLEMKYKLWLKNGLI